MKSNIFIPKKIKVGFQERSDTFTKKLAYVIYYDQKGKLRKEKSWNSWKDDKIQDLDFDNIPTSGFVLNKNVGGYKSDWNYRKSYIRIYDPRGFEFEITLDNLLYILENTNCIKGKGLEDEFVYGWDGQDLVLLPISSPDYKEITEYNDKIHSKNYIKSKELILGGKYKDKKNEEWVYLGRFNFVDIKTIQKDKNVVEYIENDKGMFYYFSRINKWNSFCVEKYKSLGDRFIECISNECVNDYADLIDKLEKCTSYSPYDRRKDEYINFTLEEFKDKLTKMKYGWISVYSNNHYVTIYKKENGLYIYSGCKEIIRTLEYLFEQLKPQYKKEYLLNGKLLREDLK